MKRPDLRRARWGPSVAPAPEGVRPEWTIVLLGYDRAQVDDVLTDLEAATARPSTVPRFPVALRGDERLGVDRYVRERLAALPESTDDPPA